MILCVCGQRNPVLLAAGIDYPVNAGSRSGRPHVFQRDALTAEYFYLEPCYRFLMTSTCLNLFLPYN